MAEIITPVIEVELSGAGMGWTDISADTNLGAAATTLKYGIQGISPIDRVASTGTLAWAMNNSARNSGSLQGYYSPGHTNARSGWELGIMVRFSLDHTTPGTQYKFLGTLVSVQPDAGTNMRQAVICRAVDWIDEAARSKLHNVGVQSGKRADEIINTVVVNSVTRQPETTDYEIGQSTFPTALDNIDEERDSVLGAIAKVVRSEFGYFYVRGDAVSGGELRFEDRHERMIAGAVSAANTFDNTMIGLKVDRKRATIINRANVVVHPRKIDDTATTVIFELTPTDTVPVVEANGGTLSFTALLRSEGGRFVRVGAKDIVTPQASIDYVANTQANGLGADITADQVVAITAQSNSVVFTLTNNNASNPANYTTLQVRGRAIQDTYQVMMTDADTASETTYGEQVVRYDMPYEDRLEQGFALADWLTTHYSAPRYGVKMTLFGNTNATLADRVVSLEPGDKIAVIEDVTGVTDTGGTGTDYHINGINISVQPGDQVRATYTLISAVEGEQDAWILEEVGSQLGTNTTLGFF